MTCGSCGTENPAAARFCLSCGHPLVTRADERRVATVLFADLVGFTSLSEDRDPEQVKNLVDRCFAELAADITEFGGQVDKILGDAIIALFGAPVAHEDDAERAVRAALRMQQTIADFEAQIDAVLQMRVGVNTGEVLVGSFHAGGEYTAMGDVVNTAQRLETRAEPGTVIVGSATYSATREIFEYEPLGEQAAKGREELVDAWLAIRPILPPGYRRRRNETPFVGRDPELGVLRHAIDATVNRSRAQLAVLFGEAGVGKSRLAEEAACQARVIHRALVIEGRCVPYGEANVWWPVAEALRQACEISTDDPLPAADHLAAVAVAAALEQPDRSPEVKRIVNGLLYLMGYEVALRDIDPARAREEAMRSVLAFVEASARHRPVVIVVSDLHWADQLVLDTLTALLERLRSSRFVVLATARLELQDRWSIPQGRHNSIIMNLDPLDREATGSLLGALVDHDLHEDLREVLLDRSGGNPFFLEELVALLADADQVPAELARADTGSLLELPDTLRGLVSARIDGLTLTERAALEDAAVWGRSGPVEALERMGESFHNFTNVRATLDSLADKEILQVSPQRWSFHSDLIREVAYGTLTKADRARRHAGISAFLESSQPDRHEASDRTVDVIAFHYGAAAELVIEIGQVSGLSGAVTAKALEWIEEAAHRAQVSQLLPVASRLFSQALRLLPDGNDARRITYLLGRAASETDLRELDGAKSDIDQALALARTTGDQTLEARGLLARGEFEQKSGDLTASLVTIADAVARFEALGDLKGQADAQRVAGITQIYQGEHDGAEASIRSALDASRQLGDRRGEAWAMQNLAWISYVAGRSVEAEKRLTAAAETFQELGDAGGLNWALGLLAFVRFHQGDLASAEALGEQILIEARDRGDRWGEGMMLLLTSSVRLWSGRAGDAVPAAQEAQQLFRQLGDRYGGALASAGAGRALVTAGRIEEGFAVLREAYDHESMLDEGGRPDQMRLVIAGSLAGASVQIGAPEIALDVMAPEHDSYFEPETIGHNDGEVTEALALLQRGQVEAAVERLLPLLHAVHPAGSATKAAGEPTVPRPGDTSDIADVNDVASITAPADDTSASPYALSVMALAMAAVGHDDEVAELSERVRGAQRSTYLDRVNARLAELFVGARISGEELDNRYAALQRDADAASDPVAQAVARLAGAIAYDNLGRPEAVTLGEDAEARLLELGISASGWRVLFDTATLVETVEPAVAD